jgi:hypothetical protein
VRLTHTYFAMLSLAFAQIVFTVVFKWKSLTGGDDGILNLWPPPALKSPVAYCYFTLAVAGAGMLALRAIVDSPFGYALRAIRENPRRARFIGVNVRRHQLFAFVLSGFFSGLAGGLFAFFNGSVFPDFAYLNKSFEPLVVVLLGGIQSFFGPLAGAVGFKILETFIPASGPCTGRSSWAARSSSSWWRCRRASSGSCRGGRGGSGRPASPPDRRPLQALRGGPGRERREPRRARGRSQGHHRPERSRQDHALQPDHGRPSARLRADLFSRH